MRRLRRDVRRRSGRRAAEAGAQRRAEAVGRRPGDRVPAPDHRRRRDATRFAYLELERLLRANARWYDLVEVLGHARRRRGGRRGASRPSWRCAWRSPTSGRRSSIRPTAPRRRWRRCCEVAPDERRRRCCRWRACTRARSAGTRPARRWSKAAANAAAPAEIAEIQFRNAQILHRARKRTPAEIERALLRALDADPTHRPTLAALEKMARDAKDDERLVQLLELALETAADDDERRRAAARRSRRSTRGPLGAPGGGAAAPRAAGGARPEGDPGARAAGRRAGRRGPHRRRGPHHERAGRAS